MCIESLTVFRSGNAEIVTIYYMYDGYPSGYGLDLAEMVAAGSSTDLGTLIVKFISQFKPQTSDMCLLPCGSAVGWQGYLYEVTGSDDRTVIFRITHNGAVLFEGTATDCLTFCKNHE